MTLIFFISFLLLMLLSVPIATSLGMSTLIGISIHESLDFLVIPQKIFASLNSIPMMAIPFFILAGFIMQTGGMSRRLVNFANSLVGHLPGGLAMVAILTCLFFSAISGSGPATVLAVGSILLPTMINKGYDAHYASANLAVAGSLGTIIPPSVALILYGIIAEVSISALFSAAILPGLLIAFSLLISVNFIFKKNNINKVEKSSFPEVIKSFKEAILALLMPVIMLGGIYTGVFTPTESAVVSVFYSLIVVMFFYREINIKTIFGLLQKTAITSAVVMIIIGMAGAFSFFISINGIPEMLTQFILGFTSNQITFLIIINILLLIVGMFIDGAAAMLIFVPMLLPTALAFGIDPIHFGIIFTVNLAMGLVTPPIGTNLFAVVQLSPSIKIARLSVKVLPLILILIVNLLIITFIPSISTFLPKFLN